jgi:Tfp pilus assembly protein PilX
MNRALFSRRVLVRLSRRGMALLLVMIGLVVCTVMTAGFLSTQGTSIGIAHNERDAAKAHAIAQSGIDMCYWLIRNKVDWRQTMPVGNWLINLPVGDGAVSVSVDDDNHCFTDDPTCPVTISATGAYDNRAFTLSATVRPTGGGTVFKNGNFIAGDISLGNSDLVTAAVLDSYNSSLASYNPLRPGFNASFASNATTSGGLKCYYPSYFCGSYSSAPTANLSNVIQLIGGDPGPIATGHALENRNPGKVIYPNTAGFTHYPAVSSPGAMWPKYVSLPGTYGDFSVTGGGNITITGSGPIEITSNLSLGIAANCALNVKEGIAANVIVRGNIIINPSCKISLLDSASRLNLYVDGNVILNGGSINSSGKTSQVVLFGGESGGTIQIANTTGIFVGSIYAPQHDVIMQTNSPKCFGAIVAKSLTLKNSAAFHFDEALRALKVDQITGGSAPPGTPDYTISINSGPIIPR